MNYEILHAMARLLDAMGEPYPDVDACIADGQYPDELYRSMAAALVYCLDVI